MKYRLIFLLALLPCMANAQENAAEMTIDDIRRTCSDNSPEFCQSSYDTIADDLSNAFKGDYWGQRNVAYCLSNGCDDATVINWEYGCAWRMVIATAGHAEFDEGDKLNLLSECGRMNETSRFRSAVQASILFNKIYGRSMPELKLN